MPDMLSSRDSLIKNVTTTSKSLRNLMARVHLPRPNKLSSF